MLSANELLDWELKSKFLTYSTLGISLNIVAFQKPTHVYRSDACEFGLGGYNVLSGRAW
jgi:hypothetical protein